MEMIGCLTTSTARSVSRIREIALVTPTSISDTKAQQRNFVLDVIIKNGLYLLPLHSVKETGCTCENPTCSSPGKHPFFKFNWKIIASRDPKRIREWMSKHERMNFGIATGRKSLITGKYLVCLDVDVAEHELIATLPKTFTYRTGRGGHHFWFWTKIPVKNSVSLLANKVDIRGTNGYVVIPPSKHVSGLDYEISQQDLAQPIEIADLPASVDALLKQAYIARKHSSTATGSTNSKSIINVQQHDWAKLNVAGIRERFLAGNLVPEGVRNTTMHRLLSSERARGALTYQELLDFATEYRMKNFQNPGTLTDSELELIVGSVMKYPTYNTSHEKVNAVYVSWLKKRGHVVTGIQNKLDLLDSEFFGTMVPSVTGKGLSLAMILKSREEFMSSRGLTKISRYRMPLLGKKLRSMGFLRARTSRCNVWMVEFRLPENKVQFATGICYNDGRSKNSHESEFLTMADEVPVVPSTEVPVIAEAPVSSTTHTVTVKRRDHPNTWKYPGRKCIDHLNAMAHYIKELTKDEIRLLSEDLLIRDPEKTNAFYAEVLPGDYIGVNETAYLVRSHTEDDDGNPVLEVINAREAKITWAKTKLLTLPDIDLGLQTGFSEILERDGKLYGVSETIDVKVKIIDQRSPAPVAAVEDAKKEVTDADGSEQKLL